MKGGYLAYHLRMNKAVERMIFIDLLGKIGYLFPLYEYKYVGFGGPFLEDFKLIHNYLGISYMVSLESDPDVVGRQEFNRPSSCIKLRHTTSEEYINDSNDFDKKLILWLDYSEADELGNQLTEFYDAIGKIKEGSIVKITINAETESLRNAKIEEERFNGCAPADRMGIIDAVRFDEFKKRVGNIKDIIDPQNLTQEDVRKNKYPKTLFKMLKTISLKAVEGTQKKIFPLTSFVYADGQTMLTFTGIIIPKTYPDDYEAFLNKTGLSSYEFMLKKVNDTPTTIDVPNLSLFEKVYLNKLLPDNSNGIARLIKFKVDYEKDKSDIKLENYGKYYRYYPNFVKIFI